MENPLKIQIEGETEWRPEFFNAVLLPKVLSVMALFPLKRSNRYGFEELVLVINKRERPDDPTTTFYGYVQTEEGKKYPITFNLKNGLKSVGEAIVIIDYYIDIEGEFN